MRKDLHFVFKIGVLFTFLILGLTLKSKSQIYSEYGTSGVRYLRMMYREDPSTTAVIGWDQNSGTGGSGIVHYGTTSGVYTNTKTVDRTVTHKAMNNNFARLTGLTPDTRYYFVIIDSEGTTSEFSFYTISDDPTQTLSIVSGGDSRSYPVDRRITNNVLDKINPHFVAFGGDYTNGNSDSEWDVWMADWQETFDDDNLIIPIVATRGNHEASNADIVNLFDVPSADVTYALTFGGNLFRLYTLNTLNSIAGIQTDWLTNDLEGSCDVQWKSAQYHHPIIAHQSGKSDYQDQYDNWAQLFYDKEMRLVMESDAHVVKMTKPVKPSGTWSGDGSFIETGDYSDGTVYVGEGTWALTRTYDDSHSWTLDGGSFTQFKWLFVTQSAIEVRTIRTAQTLSIGTVNPTVDRFNTSVLGGSSLWASAGGSVITILPSSKPSGSVTSPADGDNYPTIQTISITADAADTDGTVSQVEFFINGLSIGVDNTAPYSLDYLPASTGLFELEVVATDNDSKVSSTCVKNQFSVGNPPVISSFPVVLSSDDAEENLSSGGVNTTSTDLELIMDGSDQTVGIRFQNVTVPTGATINNAYIQFTVDETTNTNSMNVAIHGEAIDNSPLFTTANYNVSSRSKTTATANWSPPNWINVGDRTADQETSDLGSIVQEIVNRGGWSTGNNMSFILEATPGAVRTAEAGPGADAAELTITYNGGTTVSYLISNDIDDVEEAVNSGVVYDNSSDLEIGFDDFVGDNQMIGLRFRSVTIPQGATINSASIQFQVDETGAKSSNGTSSSYTIHGEASGNPNTFTTAINDITSRALTSASINWTTTEWSMMGAAGTDQQASDLAPIVEELIARGDWASGNSMAFIINGASGSQRFAESYDGTAPPQLIIEYIEPSSVLSLANFITFNVKTLESNQVLLNWFCKNLDENSNFVVERSKDGKLFQKIDTEAITSITGGYSAIDSKPFKGRNYYRIKLTSKDENIYSAVRSINVNYKKQLIISIHPNPVIGDKFNITTDYDKLDKLEIYSIKGEKINASIILKGTGVYEVLIKNASPGVYFVFALHGSNSDMKKVIVK